MGEPQRGTRGWQHLRVIRRVLQSRRASQVALVVKNPPANAGDMRDVGLIPGLRRSLEEGMATHSSSLA